MSKPTNDYDLMHSYLALLTEAREERDNLPEDSDPLVRLSIDNKVTFYSHMVKKIADRRASNKEFD